MQLLLAAARGNLVERNPCSGATTPTAPGSPRAATTPPSGTFARNRRGRTNQRP